MDKQTVRRSRVRKKYKTSKGEEDNGRKLDEESLIFPILLMLNYALIGPWNTNKFRTHWQKNLYKIDYKRGQSLRSCPTVWACYYDARGLMFEVSKKNYTETLRHINKHLGLYDELSKYAVTTYVRGSIKNTAFSSLSRMYKGRKMAMLTGVVEGRFMRQTGITVWHLFPDLRSELKAVGEDDDLKIGGGLVGECCGKVREIVIDGDMYTADIAAIYFDPLLNDPICYNQFSQIDIDGRIYQTKLWIGDESSLMPETVVWMIDQNGMLKVGRICRLLLYDKKLELYNIMQIVSENSGKSFSKRGDSGCCIFLPPNADDTFVSVIGTVISKVKDETMKLTNAVWLGKVLPYFLRSLGPHHLSRDDNLPFGLNIAEGLEFSGLADKFENLSVKSLSLSNPEYDRAEVVEARSKTLGPPNCGLFESYNHIPVECSEDSLTVKGINSDGVIQNVDSGVDTLSSVLGDQRF